MEDDSREPNILDEDEIDLSKESYDYILNKCFKLQKENDQLHLIVNGRISKWCSYHRLYDLSTEEVEKLTDELESVKLMIKSIKEILK